MSIVIDGYAIDVAVREEIMLTSDITDYPVEDGVNITDHVRNKPLEVTIEGIVSDTPIRPLADLRGLPIFNAPSEEFLSRLELMHEFRDPITIETTQRVYENMVLADLRIPRDAQTGDALAFTAHFKQVEFITNDRVEINVDLPRASKKKSLGARNPKSAPSQVPVAQPPPVPPYQYTSVSPAGSPLSV